MLVIVSRERERGIEAWMNCNKSRHWTCLRSLFPGLFVDVFIPPVFAEANIHFQKGSFFILPQLCVSYSKFVLTLMSLYIPLTETAMPRQKERMKCTECNCCWSEECSPMSWSWEGWVWRTSYVFNAYVVSTRRFDTKSCSLTFVVWTGRTVLEKERSWTLCEGETIENNYPQKLGSILCSISFLFFTIHPFCSFFLIEISSSSSFLLRH